MSKLIRKLGKVLGPKKNSAAENELQVDAVPIEETPVEGSGNEIVESTAPTNIPGGAQQPTQANQYQFQFNNPQTVYQYQFSHANGVHIGNSYAVNNHQEVHNEIGQEEDKPDVDAEVDTAKKQPTLDSAMLRKKYPKTRTIDAMMKSEMDLEHPIMDVIATHLGEDWRSVVRDLGFSNGEIDHFYEDNFAYGVKEVIYKILSEWRQREEEPHLGKICQVLWSRDIHREVVYKLKLDLKRRQQEL